MLAHASRSTPKRSACPRGENAATAARPVCARRIVSSTAHLARHQRNQNCRRHGARKVETRALLPMAGTSYALAVALHASKAKLPALVVATKGQVAGAAPPLALLASAVLAAVASLLVTKGLNEEVAGDQEASSTTSAGSQA
mmetsp:Transcript_7866/g.27090  ORF Transcript_7866/g.27090 Transcript_7866/m.27090 type:complete len:142 (-) Transcript_7866:149-574(-)